MKNIIFYICIVLFTGCKQNIKHDNSTIVEDKNEIDNEIPSTKSDEDYSYELVPGERLGPIILNQNSTKVLDSLGKPDSGDAAMGKAVATWHEGSKDQLSIYTTTQMGVEDFSRIKAVRTLSPDYRTQDNLGVNSTKSEIEKYYSLNKAGNFTSEGDNYILYSTEEGIGFEIGEDQNCHGIVLTEKGTEPQRMYLTFYPELEKTE